MRKVTDSMNKDDPASDEYRKKVIVLDRLNEMKAKASRRVSPDTIAICVVNLVGIAMYMLYENRHVITSKAVPLPMRTERSK